MTKNVEVMEFEEEELLQVPVKIGSTYYLLQEASGDVVIQHRNNVLAFTKLNPDGGIASYSGMASAEPILISKCLFKTKERESDSQPLIKTELVTLEFVNGLRHRTMSKLFNRLKEISGMNDDESLEALEKQYKELGDKIAEIKKTNEKVKNSQSDTVNG